MSSTKMSKQSSGTATPAKNDAVSLRRSSRLCRKAIHFSPQEKEEEEEDGEMSRIKRNPSNKKKQQVVESEEEEIPLDDLNPVDHVKQPEVAEPIDVPSSPEETKPDVDLLWMVEHVAKPYSDDGIPAVDLKQLAVAASIVKSDLVSRLTSSTNQSSIEDMIKDINDCSNTLRRLRDKNIKSFRDEVCKLIEDHMKLKLVASEKENWADSEIETQYLKQVDMLSKVTAKLCSAQDDLARSKMVRDSLSSRKNELTAMFMKVVDDLNAVEAKILTLTSEWHRCKEDRSGVAAEVKKLGSQKEEAAERLKAINARYEAAKEEMENMKKHLLDLVSKQ